MGYVGQKPKVSFDAKGKRTGSIAQTFHKNGHFCTDEVISGHDGTLSRCARCGRPVAYYLAGGRR
jgi:hypothetical protein